MEFLDDILVYHKTWDNNLEGLLACVLSIADFWLGSLVMQLLLLI